MPFCSISSIPLEKGPKQRQVRKGRDEAAQWTEVRTKNGCGDNT